MFEAYDHLWDFKLLDTGDGYRLEKWGEVLLARPEPQIIWQKSLPDSEWSKAWAIYKSPADDNRAVPHTGSGATGTGGRWEVKKPLPQPWILSYQNIKFLLKLSPFKHTGLFAEQAAQWNWMSSKIKDKGLRILNLFAYTGGATMVLAKMGCQITHVDASKPTLAWANENHKLNNLSKESVRWILDDAVKFVKRELKRGSKYDGIIMDPPAFGHSPQGKPWKFNDDLPGLLADSVKLLSDDAKFLIINGYATNSSAIAVNNLLEDAMRGHKGKIEFGELCLKQKNSRMISTGIFARWSPN